MNDITNNIINQSNIKDSIREFWINKNILITGGTKGLGKALAIHLASLKGNVTVVARNRDRIENMRSEYPNIHYIIADVSDKEDTYKISAQFFARHATIDVLFNNASYLGSTPLNLLLDTDCEDLEQVLNTNLMGVFRLTKAILPTMLLVKSGLIVNISSDAAIQAYPTWGSYSISKSALDHMSRIWQEELTESGVNMIAMDPGDMATDMHFEAIPDAVADDLYQPMNVAQDMSKFIATLISYNSDLSMIRYTAKQWRNNLS